MAQLTEAQKDELDTELQQLFSQHWYPIDPFSDQLRAGLDVFDAGMETAESDILNSVGQVVRDWLVAHPKLARYILERVAQKRREVL